MLEINKNIKASHSGTITINTNMAAARSIETQVIYIQHLQHIMPLHTKKIKSFHFK